MKSITETEQSESSSDYEVERILEKRIRSGKVEYLVKWVGYSEEDNEWISED